MLPYHSPMPDEDDGTDYLTLAQVAAELGWTITTARSEHRDASRRRRSRQSRPGDLPAPDHRYGRTPVWHRQTIAAWRRQRPGRGAGGGRPSR